MFVLGRNTDGHGTVLPAVFEFIVRNPLLEVSINLFVTSEDSVARAGQDLARLVKFIGRDLKVNLSVLSNLETLFSRISADPHPKAAIVSVPDHLHFEFVRRALTSGCNTLVVKPFVESVGDARKLIALSRELNLHGAVEFHKRWDQSNLVARDLIRQNKLGKILSININYSQKREVPLHNFKSWAGKTTILQYLGSHYIDLTYFLTGATPVRAMAIGAKKLLKAAGIDTYDEITSLVEWEHPAHGQFVLNLRTGWVDSDQSPAMSNQHLCISGTNGELELDQRDRGVRMNIHGSAMELVNPYFSRSYQIEGRETFRGYGITSVVTFLEDCARISRGEITPTFLEGIRPTFQSSLTSVLVIETLLDSLSKEGQWVSVSP